MHPEPTFSPSHLWQGCRTKGLCGSVPASLLFFSPGICSQECSMVVDRKISNIQGWTSVEGWKALMDDAMGQGHPHFAGAPYSVYSTKPCITAEKTEFICSLLTSAESLVYAESQIPEGDPGPSTGWHFTDPDLQVHFRSLRLARALWVWPPGHSGPPQGLALCSLSWEVSWLRTDECFGGNSNCSLKTRC